MSMMKDVSPYRSYEELTDGIEDKNVLMLYVNGILTHVRDAIRVTDDYRKQEEIIKRANKKFRLVLDAAYMEGWSDMRAYMEKLVFESRDPGWSYLHEKEDYRRPLLDE